MSVQCKDGIFANSNLPCSLRDVLDREALHCFTLVTRARVKHNLISRPETRHCPPPRQRPGIAWGCLRCPGVFVVSEGFSGCFVAALRERAELERQLEPASVRGCCLDERRFLTETLALEIMWSCKVVSYLVCLS